MWHFIFDYNYDISWPIFTFFAANETGVNTLHFTYLMAWWRHKFVIVHIVKVYFIAVADDFLIKNLWQCKGFTARRLMKEFPNKNWKRRILEDYLMNFVNVWWPSGKTCSNMWLAVLLISGDIGSERVSVQRVDKHSLWINIAENSQIRYRC